MNDKKTNKETLMELIKTYKEEIKNMDRNDQRKEEYNRRLNMYEEMLLKE